jgi:hypothetical protein
LSDEPPACYRQVEPFEHVSCLVRGTLEEITIEIEVLLRGQFAVEVRELEAHAHLVVVRAALFPQVFSEHLYPSGVAMQDPREELLRRAFARAVRAEKAEDLTLGDSEVQVRNGRPFSPWVSERESASLEDHQVGLDRRKSGCRRRATRHSETCPARAGGAIGWDPAA